MRLFKRGKVWWVDLRVGRTRERFSTRCTNKRAAELVARLRGLADWVEDKPIIASAMRWYASTVNVFPREKWQEALREAGSYRKSSVEAYLCAVVEIPGGVRVELNASKEDTCTRVKVGEREVEVERYPDDVEVTIVTETQDVFEWQCPESWMSPS